ncbi:MAG: calcium/sodium antiporter [Akkermansiaceae bacterium]|jgi:cation:H+ antiporter|nr:calcium/sodium antiporter [Akkermansiaceae bacterium]
MLVPILILVVCFVVLTVGADLLVRGAGSLALRLGITPLVVGLTVVAFGTSAPELVVSLKAAWAGQGDIAAGNVIGSNIFNIGMILGVAALISPLRVQLQLLKVDAPLMLLTAVVLAVMLLDRRVDRLEGAVLAAGIVAYLVFTVVAARKQHTAEVDSEFEEGVPHRTTSPLLDILLIVGGIALLIVSSRFLVSNAIVLARHVGVSEAVIGLTIVAAGTSLPELATSVVAACKKEADIAIGNIIGSNIFNVLAIMGIAGASIPFAAPGVKNSDLVVMVAFSVVLVPMLITGGRLGRWEGGLLLVGFLAYLASQWPS